MKPYPVEFRQKIIDVYNQEKPSIRNLAQRFYVAKSFVQKLLKQHQETGNIRPHRQGGNPEPKLKKDQLVDLVEIIETHNDATLEELCDLLFEKVQVRVSRSTMGRITQKLNYSVKKTLYAAEKERESVRNQRVEFWEIIREVRVEDLIFIDESGVNLAMVRLYARALRGKRARGKRPQKRGKNISMLTALSLKEVVASVNIYRAVDGVTFEAVIRQKLVPELWKGAFVVLDNAKIHLGEMVREMIEAVKAKLVYLSAYSPEFSPEFSPIENFWSKVKSILRKTAARTYQELVDGITHTMLEVTQENIRNWVTHCCYCAS